MTYSATAFRLLLSAPSDVPQDDIRAAVESVIRWNVIYGQQSAAVVVPTNWASHSVATYGMRPQEALNAQLVDESDIVIALFWHRLGSPTGEADSGTLEEIERAHANGAYVGILRCKRPLPPTEVDTAQLNSLNEFYDRVESFSLLVDYEDGGELKSHVDSILAAATTAARTRVRAEAEANSDLPAPAEVWPRIETSPVTETDARGRLRTKNQHRLVVSNIGATAARNVRWRLELEDDSQDGALPLLLEPPSPIEVLAPRGDVAYTIFATAAAARQFRAVVQWEDPAGEHENAATLRLY
jgi:hypothetical protein